MSDLSQVQSFLHATKRREHELKTKREVVGRLNRIEQFEMQMIEHDIKRAEKRIGELTSQKGES